VTTVGQRVGVRVGVRVGMRASAPVVSPVVTHALDMDGLTRWGWGEWASAPEQAGGMSLVVELADGTGTTTAREPARLMQASGGNSILSMRTQNIQGRISAYHWTDTPAIEALLNATSVDSASYALYAAMMSYPDGDTAVTTRRIALAAATTTATATREIRSTKRRLLMGSSSTTGASLFIGKIARWSVWPGLLSAEEMVLLYQDETAWEASIPDRLPHGVWYAQDGVDATTTLVVPARYKGPDGLAPDVVFVATNRSDLSTTVPTRTA